MGRPTHRVQSPSWSAGSVERSAVPSWMAPKPAKEAPPPNFGGVDVDSTYVRGVHDGDDLGLEPDHGMPADESEGQAGISQLDMDTFRQVFSQPPGAIHVEPAFRPSSVPNPIPELTLELETLKAELASLRSVLTETIGHAATARRRALEGAERDVVGLAVAIAKRVLRKELETDASIVARWAKEGVDALAGAEKISVAVGPEMLEKIPQEVWNETLPEGVTLSVDARLSGYTCQVRSESSSLEHSLESRLDAVVNAVMSPQA